MNVFITPRAHPSRTELHAGVVEIVLTPLGLLQLFYAKTSQPLTIPLTDISGLRIDTKGGEA